MKLIKAELNDLTVLDRVFLAVVQVGYMPESPQATQNEKPFPVDCPTGVESGD